MQMKNEKDTIKEMFNNDNYITWLNTFLTNDYLVFDNEETLLEKLNKDDCNNLSNLKLFFKIIEQYAIDNYLVTSLNNYQKSYYLKWHNNFFQIGIITSDFNNTNTTYISKTSISHDKDFIDYDDLKKYIKKQENIDYDKHLNYLEKYIQNLLYYYHIPVSAILATTNNTINYAKRKVK